MVKVAVQVIGNGSIPDVLIGGKTLHLNNNATLANDTLLEVILHLADPTIGISVSGPSVKDSRVIVIPPGD